MKLFGALVFVALVLVTLIIGGAQVSAGTAEWPEGDCRGVCLPDHSNPGQACRCIFDCGEYQTEYWQTCGWYWLYGCVNPC
jgi:hypothetical protein